MLVVWGMWEMTINIEHEYILYCRLKIEAAPDMLNVNIRYIYIHLQAGIPDFINTFARLIHVLMRCIGGRPDVSTTPPLFVERVSEKAREESGLCTEACDSSSAACDFISGADSRLTILTLANKEAETLQSRGVQPRKWRNTEQSETEGSLLITARSQTWD